MTEQEQEERFKKGFNYGYMLARYDPKLLEKVLAGRNERDDYTDKAPPFIRGIRRGKDKYEFDRGWKEQVHRINAAEKSGQISKEAIDKFIAQADANAEKSKEQSDANIAAQQAKRAAEIEKLKQQAKQKGKDRER